MVSAEPVCSVCRRRPAVYKRTYSGQLLCPRCLARSLEKAVRASVGRAGGIRPGSRAAVPLSFSAPHYSLALARLAARVERRFNVELVVLAPRAVEVEAGAPQGVEIVWVDVEPPRGVECDSTCCWRFDSAWAAREALQRKIEYVLLPVTLTDRIIIALEALISGQPCHLAGFEPGYEHPSGVRVVKAFSTVEGEAVSAYVAVEGIRAWAPCAPRSPAKTVLYSIARGRPELEYSFEKALGPVAWAESCGRCRVCGWPAAGDTCPYCRMLGLELPDG